MKYKKVPGYIDVNNLPYILNTFYKNGFHKPIKSAESMSAKACEKCINDGLQHFIVGEELYNSMKDTILSKDFTFSQIQFPVKSGVFLLPDEQVIIFGIVKAGEKAMKVTVKSSTVYTMHVVGDIACAGYKELNCPIGGGTTEAGIPGISVEDAQKISSKINSILYTLLTVLSIRPELMEPHRQLRKPKKGKPDLWEPRWLGRTYKYPKNELGGTHSSPRLHVRKGHIRNQKYGEGLNMTKQIWIEPFLVGDKSS